MARWFGKVRPDAQSSCKTRPSPTRRAGRCWMRSSATVPGRCWRRRCRPRSPRYVDAHRGEVDERRAAGWWSATATTQPREVTTAAGAVPVRQPRVNDKRIDEVTGERQRFSSAILPAWSRKSPRVAEVLPLLYLHGLSSLGLRAGVGAVPRLRRRACPRRRSPGSPRSGKTRRGRSTPGRWPARTTCTAGSTAST